MPGDILPPPKRSLACVTGEASSCWMISARAIYGSLTFGLVNFYSNLCTGLKSFFPQTTPSTSALGSSKPTSFTNTELFQVFPYPVYPSQLCSMWGTSLGQPSKKDLLGQMVCSFIRARWPNQRSLLAVIKTSIDSSIPNIWPTCTLLIRPILC